MRNWTRRDLVKASLLTSAASMTSGKLFADTAAASRAANVNEFIAAPGESIFAEAGNPLRDHLLLDSGWRFALGNANDPEKDFGFGKLRRGGTFAKAGHVDGPAHPAFDDSKWQPVDLPHDWAVALPFVDAPDLPEHGGKPLGREYPETSIGWYRRKFDVPTSDEGKRITVEFDGIFRNAMLFFNGQYIDVNMSGYAPLRADLTDFVNYGGSNVLVVRVDATLDEGWFYEGAGIYRHVWLNKTAPVHIAQWGNYVRSTVKANVAMLAITTEVQNETEKPAQGRVRASILDADGKTIATAVSQPATVDAGATCTFPLEAKVSAPALWSPETPHLYQLVTVLEADGKALDQEATTFGIRTIRFDANKGFLLNGQPVKIKGTCNHQDHAGVGAAIPDRLQYYRIALLKQMGSNACRTSHNMPTPAFMDACDRLGMMVMDETRMMSSCPEGLSELERLVKRDRNHPSVILWSLGNEEPEQGTPVGARVVASMKRLVRRLDPSRPVTVAMNGAWGKGLSAVVDVQGFNYFRGDIDAFHKEFPDQPTVGTETASTVSTRGIYENDAVRGYVSAYDVNKPSWASTAEGWWKYYDERPWLSGGFVWTGFDYRGEPTPYSWPCISSHFGLMDTCGFPKDNYFYYKTWWSGEPTLHLFPHWNWRGEEGAEIIVWCYCNQDSVELFLNGKSLGSQSVEKNGHLEWKVKYMPGVLEARAKKDGKVTLVQKRETTGAGARVVVSPDRSSINADGEDVVVLNVSVVDAQGRVVPTASHEITFYVSGAGKLIGVGNGDPSCHEPDKPQADGTAMRSAFNGYCQAIVQANRQAGAITIKATSPGLETATVTVSSEVSTPRPSVGPSVA